MHQVLLIEDDRAVQAAISRALEDRGFAVRTAGTALEALQWVTHNEPDVVILDLGLPDLDGASVLHMLRGISDVPVVVATARGGERSVVELLNAGADDYVVKPFSSGQLVARIEALLRRTARKATDDTTVIEVGGLCIDIRRHTVHLDGRQLELNRREFELLTYLAARPDTVISKQELLREVWRQRQIGDDGTIDVHVSWLRRKLGESAARPRFLYTVRGVGIKLVTPS